MMCFIKDVSPHIHRTIFLLLGLDGEKTNPIIPLVHECQKQKDEKSSTNIFDPG